MTSGAPPLTFLGDCFLVDSLTFLLMFDSSSCICAACQRSLCVGKVFRRVLTLYLFPFYNRSCQCSENIWFGPLEKDEIFWIFVHRVGWFQYKETYLCLPCWSIRSFSFRSSLTQRIHWCCSWKVPLLWNCPQMWGWSCHFLYVVMDRFLKAWILGQRGIYSASRTSLSFLV